MSFLWPGVISRASVPRGIATLIFHVSGVDLSESSLGHPYQLSPKCTPEAFWISFFSKSQSLHRSSASHVPMPAQGTLPPLQWHPTWLSGEESAMQKTWVRALGWKIPWRRKWEPTPLFLPGKPHGQRSLAGFMARTRSLQSQARLSKHACPPFMTVYQPN